VTLEPAFANISKGIPMIKKLIATATLCAITFVSISGEPPKAAAIAVAEAEAVVELVSIDRASRMVLMRGPTGDLLYIQIPPAAQNLDRVKPGDLFRMRYIEALALALHKGGAASASEGQTIALAPKGGTPGGTVVSTKEMSTVVTAIDRPARRISVRGADKNAVTLKVADEVRSFDEIAVGDTIAVTYTEALAIEMITDTPPKP
jgi:hypothetical protein